jgi:hypothetical protein
MDLVEVGWGDVDWTGLAEESSCECGNEPSCSIKYWETYEVATQLVVSRVVLSSTELV